MANIKRTSALGIAAAAAAGLIIAPAASATPDPGTSLPDTSANAGNVGRISGIDRIQVAVEASKASVGAFGGTVIVAGSMQFADSLAAAPLADVLDARVLITNSGNLDSRVAAEITRLGADNVIIVGGVGTVGSAVEAALAKLVGEDNVDRIGGADRYEVAYNVAADTAAAYGNPAAGDLAWVKGALREARQAQARLDAAHANYLKESKEFEAALGKWVAARANYEAAQKVVADLAKQLIVPEDAYTDAEIAAQQAVVAGLVADYTAKAQSLAFLSTLGEAATGSTLDIKSTLGEYYAVLDAAGDAKLDKAKSVFGLDNTTTLESALATATTATNAANAAIAPQAEILSDMLAKNAEVAAQNAANAEVLKKLEAANAKLAAAKKAYEDAEGAFDKAFDEFDAAKQELIDATEAAPYPGEIAYLVKELAKARSEVVKAAGNHTVFAARGDIHSDALPAGAAASDENGVVLLTTGPTAGAWTNKYLSESNAQVVTIGGFATQALGSKATTKIVGSDRYDNARDVAVKYFNGSEPVAIASGEAYADATVAGSFIANHDGALLLTAGSALSKATEEYLSFQSENTAVRVFGGRATISNDVIVDIEWAMTH